MESNECLPSLATLSSTDLSFLDERLRETLDLAGAPAIVSELQLRCEDLDKALIDLNLNLQSALLAYASFSDGFHDLSVDASSNLTDLTELTRSQRVVSGGEEECRKEKILGEELPALAKEVARVETVRAYAETALRLDTLVGDVEDAVSAAMSTTLRRNSSARSSNEKQLVAIQKLGQTEDVLTSITKKHPQWTRLVSAVDNRLDRALTILRPQAIADHRALLSSLGWPPPLSILSSSNLDTRKSTEVPNPLFTMHGDLKHQYCENFLNLCRLQEVQTRRKSRQLEGHYREVALHQPLWAIEELVNPIALACQKHFSMWIEKPEFIFALGYKITRDYVDTMDELLQPLVDEARLVGYSCREEWIAAMVSSLCTYLAKEVFPIYIGQLEDVTNTDVQGQARISWLNVVDLMIAFDKRIQPLATHSGILNTLQEDENLQKISSLSVFSDRPDWLNIWVQLELNDTLKKLKHEIENERNWKMKSKQADLLTGSENYKSPSVSSACLRCLSLVVERCRSLPTRSMRSRLLRGAGAPIIQKFLDSVLLRCQEAEGLTALTDDDSLVKVAECVNAVHHVESVLKEWCEDIFFLEMGSDHDDSWGTFTLNSSDRMEAHDGSNAILNGEVKKLEEFRNEWVEKIAVVILRGFDARSRDYVNNRKQWQEKSEEGAVSKTLLGALDYLQAKMTVVEENLNQMDFVCVWRSLAAGIDRLILSGILIRNVKFNDNGVERFSKDLEVVFGVFGAWCIRPEGFFRKTTEGLKLLKMGKRQQQDGLAGGTEWTKKNGIRHLSVAEAGKILNGRVFAS